MNEDLLLSEEEINHYVLRKEPIRNIAKAQLAKCNKHLEETIRELVCDERERFALARADERQKVLNEVSIELEKIHWELSRLHIQVNENMVWGKTTTRKDGDNIRYIVNKIQEIDNRIYNLKQGKVNGGRG